MDESAMWDQLVEIFRDTLDEPDLELGREMTANDVAGWDSITNIQLLVAIEQAFQISLRTGEIAGLTNVGELADLIAARTGGRE